MLDKKGVISYFKLRGGTRNYGLYPTLVFLLLHNAQITDPEGALRHGPGIDNG
ncbi:MAG: hypothetical protein KAJ15_06660 [Spirochaetes bacterium]|nr:hypothetical protein [Spirochaetota bacterium]